MSRHLHRLVHQSSLLAETSNLVIALPSPEPTPASVRGGVIANLLSPSEILSIWGNVLWLRPTVPAPTPSQVDNISWYLSFLPSPFWHSDFSFFILVVLIFFREILFSDFYISSNGLEAKGAITLPPITDQL